MKFETSLHNMDILTYVEEIDVFQEPSWFSRIRNLRYQPVGFRLATFMFSNSMKSPTLYWIYRCKSRKWGYEKL